MRCKYGLQVKDDILVLTSDILQANPEKDMQGVFSVFDKAGNGLISHDDLRAAIKVCSHSLTSMDSCRSVVRCSFACKSSGSKLLPICAAAFRFAEHDMQYLVECDLQMTSLECWHMQQQDAEVTTSIGSHVCQHADWPEQFTPIRKASLQSECSLRSSHVHVMISSVVMLFCNLT